MLSDRLPERWKRDSAIDQGDGFVLLIRAIKISSSSLKYYKLTLLITRASTFKFISRDNPTSRSQSVLVRLREAKPRTKGSVLRCSRILNVHARYQRRRAHPTSTVFLSRGIKISWSSL